MSFFESYFGIVGTKTETAVCCPFPHTANGTAYYEQHPSAHVNMESGLFHCKACNRGHSQVSFIQEIMGCDFITALELARLFGAAQVETLSDWEEGTALTGADMIRLNNFGISAAVAQELRIRSRDDGALMFPVLYYDRVLDIRHYRPGKHPKVKSREFATAGLIIPFDIWRNTAKDRITLICAGEKDMAVARSHGFNAITITAGEAGLPCCIEEFRGRKVVIVYDNDAAGIEGAIQLADHLQPIAASVRNCTGFHAVCKEDKEDITDFFTKYHKTREDLIEYIRTTPEFEMPESHKAKHMPLVTLLQASTGEYVNKAVRSNIQVVATSDASFIIPRTITGEKMKAPANGENNIPVGTLKSWSYTFERIADVLHLMDNNFTEADIKKNALYLMRILQKESNVVVHNYGKLPIYKCYVTDMFETNGSDAVAMEYTAYACGMKLESGKKYLVTHKLVPHPYKGQQLVMLIYAAEQANDSVTNFKVTPEVMQNLQVIQQLPGTVREKIEDMTERFKSYLGYNGNNQLIQTMDLAYNTALQFHFGQFQNIRAYLDTLIVSESRAGKSSTADAMRRTYGLGICTSLAGNAATIPGLIGGSNKTSNGYQTRAGVIPQNHKGLIVFEELGKSNNSVVSELTDIRSSNEVRISRVAGTLTLPAVVRMIALSNVKTEDGGSRPIASYPHGISILADLIGAAEDIARYDMILILADRANQDIDPFWKPREALPESVLRTRVRWVWSRTAEQIEIQEEVGRYIIEQANTLNHTYSCHIKIFGTEAWKKLARLSIAVAGYVVSASEDYQRIIVKQEHVDFARDFLIALYDNPTFKLKEYAEHERRFATIDDNGVALLQDIYNKCPALIHYLEQADRTTRNTLISVAGISNDEYNAQMNRLTAGLFIMHSKYDIIPTERFRLGLARINKNAFIRPIMEVTV